MFVWAAGLGPCHGVLLVPTARPLTYCVHSKVNDLKLLTFPLSYVKSLS